MNRNFIKTMLLLVFLLIAISISAIIFGSVNIPLKELFVGKNADIAYLRFLRTLTAIVAGIGLAACGITLQAIFRNPLAEPYLLGISSGAGLLAVIAVMVGAAQFYLPPAAFLGAILSVFIVYGLASQNNRTNEYSLILCGVIVSIAFSAITAFLITITANEAIHGLTWWLWGNFQVYDTRLLIMVSFIVVSGAIIIYFFAQDLNAISLGSEEAMHLGIEVERIKKILILIATIITAGIVSLCGIIGFVGLIIPHLMRIIVGPNHKFLIPVSVVSAACFLVICDIISRVAFAPLEIPVGVITAVLGAPLFIFLLKKDNRIK